MRLLVQYTDCKDTVAELGCKLKLQTKLCTVGTVRQTTSMQPCRLFSQALCQFGRSLQPITALRLAACYSCGCGRSKTGRMGAAQIDRMGTRTGWMDGWMDHRNARDELSQLRAQTWPKDRAHTRICKRSSSVLYVPFEAPH